MDDRFKVRRSAEGRILTGLILVVVGAALLLRNSGFPFPGWLFSWPVLLIVIGIYSGIKHQFRNNTWIILMGIGGFFLMDRFIPDLHLAPYFWPVMIIAVGVLFILRPDRSRWGHWGNDEKKNTMSSDIGTGWTKADTAVEDDDLLKVSSVFSGVERNIVSKNFQGGRVSCVFGGADIDLSKADLQGKAEIRFEVVFGGVKLEVPPHWIVYNQIDGIFHGVEDKRRYNAADTGNEKILVLKGSVIFGGVEIKSY